MAGGGASRNHTIKIFWNKYYQLLPGIEIQQNAITGIFNASLFSLGSYCSSSATYSQREWQVAFSPTPSLPRLSNRRWEQGKEDASPATTGTAGWDFSLILTRISDKPQRGWEPSMHLCRAHQLGGRFHLPPPLFLTAKPNRSPTLLSIILYITMFAWGADLRPCRIPALQLHQILT